MACQEQECYTANLATFRKLFPGLATIDDTDVQESLDRAGCELDDDNWGCTKPQAQLYLAAHQIAWTQNAAASTIVDENGNVITNPTAGSLSSASAGGLSVSYSQTMQATSGNPLDAYYSSTPYGVVFLSLKYQRMPMALLAVC